MRPITTATIMALALSACSQTGTIEGNIYLVTAEGELRRGTGARVYLVPERADQDLWDSADTLCTQAWNWQEYSLEKRRASREDFRRFFERQADSIRQVAAGLPPARRTEKLRGADAMLTHIYAQSDSLELAWLSDPHASATSWLRQKLQPLYASAAVDSAKADVDGHYILDGVPRGSYKLVAFTELRTDLAVVGWRLAVHAPGGLRKHHLDNDALMYLPIVCSQDASPAAVEDSE